MKIAILCDVTPGSRLRFHRLSEELGAFPIIVGVKKNWRDCLSRLSVRGRLRRSLINQHEQNVYDIGFILRPVMYDQNFQER